MKIKKGLDVCTSDFLYDLTCGGYIKPREICAEEKDAIAIEKAIAVIMDFYNSCKKEIDGFIQ